MRRIALAASLALAACGGDEVLPPPTTPVTGGLRLAWSFTNASGDTLDCAAAMVDQMSIDIGKGAADHPCADGSVSFGGLLPDRYPIVARALGPSGTPRASFLGNGLVVAGSTVTVELPFVIDPSAGQVGDLVVRWRVDSRDPRTQCAVVGAPIAHVISAPGSIQAFDERAPCADGSVTIHGLRAGSYGPVVRLETGDGTRVAVGVGDAVRVEPDTLVETENINVITVTGAPTQLLAQWTINSTRAVDACGTVAGRTVTFATVPRQGIVASSTTVPCMRGQARLRDGIGPGTIDVRLTLQYSVASVTSTLVQDVMLTRGKTSTVTYDFRAE